MTTRLRKIEAAFKNYGIKLKDKIDDSIKYAMQDSVTNQFLKVEDINGNQYLIRINGKLWPPFTREAEDDNLRHLKESNITNNVIINDNTHGFQICHFYNEANRFSKLNKDGNFEEFLMNIALGIKKYHEIGHFNNKYPINSTVNSSFQRLEKTEQEQLKPHYEIVLSMLYALNSDAENHVSSHNDLLPSSIYVKNANVTFVDWEYSGESHRSYDLSLFAIKAKLTPQQEQKLVTAYDSSGNKNIPYSMAMMKPVVNFLLLIWNVSSNHGHNNLTANSLYVLLNQNIENALFNQSAQRLTFTMRLCFFNRNEHEMNISSKKKDLQNAPKYFLN